MKFLIAIDSYLLKKFQAYSEYKQVTTDKNCYYFAYESYKFDVLLSKLITSILAVCGVVATGYTPAIIVPVYLIMSLLIFRHHHQVMRYVSVQTRKIPEPPPESRYGSIVMYGTLMVWEITLGYTLKEIPFVFAFFLAMALSKPAAVCTLYFVSCTPLPPETLEFRRNAKRSVRKAGAFKPQIA